MVSVKTSSPGSKRRRGSDKSARKFDTKESDRRMVSKKKHLPVPATLPRKAQRANRTFRFMIFGAMFFVVLSTVMSRRARVVRQLNSANEYNFKKHRPFRSLFGFRKPAGGDAGSGGFSQVTQNEQRVDESSMRNTDKNDGTDNAVDDSDKTLGSSAESSQSDSARSDQRASVDSESTVNGKEDEQLQLEELPERIEWYTRDDFKEGSRPMCRISNIYLVSNGTILLPDWMANYEKLLQRCGLTLHSFYSSSTGPEGLERTRDIDADFALTIRPEKFQEPTNVPSVYLTEHVLKASYLFDVFSGYARPEEGVNEHHCYTKLNNSSCSLPRPARTLLKPAIFVPKRIEMSPADSWTRRLVDMFGNAHGSGHEVMHLNVSTILMKSHEDKSEGLVGTRFRSIMTTDGMFRHLPAKGLQQSNFYSKKNGIDKEPKIRTPGSACEVTIGITNSDDPETGIDGTAELKEKIEALGKIAVPDSSIETKLIEFKTRGGLEDHIKEVQGLDIYVGGSGDEMSSIGYLREKSFVLELMPFGIKPNTHESLARALGINYQSMGGKPQVDSFKRCIDGEIFNLRKKGKLSFTETPEWKEPLMKAWDDAAGEFVLSGRSALDLLTAEEPVKNYHSKHCAERQKIEVGIDDVARQVVLLVKQTCTQP